MDEQSKLNYAKTRLALAKTMADHGEVEKWTEHVKTLESSNK